MSGSAERNSVLIKRIQSGDESALDELISLNMGLVKNIAARFRERGTDYEDLVQLGVIGMIKAARSFDFSFNTVFSTYAVPLIIGEIRRFLRDDGMIKVSRSLKKVGSDALRCKEKFIAENGREPRLSELSQLCGVDAEELVSALEAIGPVHSLSESGDAGGDDDSPTLENMIGETDSRIDGLTDRIALCEAIKKLPPVSRQLIILRYFKEMSQQQTGNILGMTQVKVSREEKKIMEKLRDAL